MSYFKQIDDREPILKAYEIRGFDINMYCKITEYGDPELNNYKCTMSFGTGFKKFCLIASYSQDKQNEIYIDRIQKKDICIINNKLSNIDQGTIKFVKVALWTIKLLYPHVRKYTLKDDSQVYCNGEESKETMHLGFDYILKYNETWYQNKFNAELPGFISKNKIENSNLINIISTPGSLMESVYNSFTILDKEITPLPLVSDILPVLLKYKDEYNSSPTPREFINKLRAKLKNKYCNEVGKWLNQYMQYLHINIEMDKWYILNKYISKPRNYRAINIPTKNINTKLNGGKRCTRKKYKYGIVSNSNLTKSMLGNYNEY